MLKGDCPPLNAMSFSRKTQLAKVPEHIRDASLEAPLHEPVNYILLVMCRKAAETEVSRTDDLDI